MAWETGQARLLTGLCQWLDDTSPPLRNHCGSMVATVLRLRSDHLGMYSKNHLYMDTAGGRATDAGRSLLKSWLATRGAVWGLGGGGLHFLDGFLRSDWIRISAWGLEACGSFETRDHGFMGKGLAFWLRECWRGGQKSVCANLDLILKKRKRWYCGWCTERWEQKWKRLETCENIVS